MASEQSFVDRYGRGMQMQVAIAGFSPAFDPVDLGINPGNFATFLGQIDTLNTDLGADRANYTMTVNQREHLIKSVKDRAMRVRDFVAANSMWDDYTVTLRRLTSKICGYRSRKPKPPAECEEGGTPAAARRQQGEQSFAEITENFEQLIAVVQTISNYAPTIIDIAIVTLETLRDDLRAENAAMGAAASAITTKQRQRSNLYEGPNGLKDRMKAIKKGVRAQYGSDSPEYTQVKSIRV